MDCTDEKCKDCPDWKIEQEIKDCNFSCPSGLLTSHRGYMELWRRYKALQAIAQESQGEPKGLLTKVCHICNNPFFEEVRYGQKDPTCVECIGKVQSDDYKKGIAEGLKRYAWWGDGVQQVGTCGTTLKSALEDIGD